MPAHLRVSVPDRPGSLAALTSALAAVGANVLSVAVLDREGGRAVDDLLLDWPYGRSWDSVTSAVDSCAGVRVHGLRHVNEPAVGHDGDLLRQGGDQAERGSGAGGGGGPPGGLADWGGVVGRRQP